MFAARAVLPIVGPPLVPGWIEIRDGLIERVGAGPAPAGAQDLGGVALLPGLVNAHTHLELSWMAGLVPPSGSMVDWIRSLIRLRVAGPPGGDADGAEAAVRAAVAMRESGIILVGDVSNTLESASVLARAGLSAMVFHEILAFNPADPAAVVREAAGRITRAEAECRASTVTGSSAPAIEFSIVAHSPYSVSPALFAEIARNRRDEPLSVHLGESPEEIEFLRTSTGPFRDLLADFGVWNPSWVPPQCDPVEYLERVGYLLPGLMAVHAVHLTDTALERLRDAGGFVVTCPRSNTWVGAGLPRVSHFYGVGVPVAIGTDSLASCDTLSVFDELAELRRIAPDVSAASLLDSATRVGAQALGFADRFGTLEPGKRAALIAVDLPATAGDVEEYLVSGVPAASVRHLAID